MDAILKSVRAMPSGARRVLRESLERLKERYREDTYAYRSITKWLTALEAIEAEERKTRHT